MITCVCIYAHMLTTSALSSYTLVEWQVAQTQHWTTEVNASKFS